MKIVRHTVPRMTLEEFAAKHDLTLDVVERPPWILNVPPFYAKFADVDVAENGCSFGVFGNGQTEEEAIANYVPEISGKWLWIRVQPTDEDRTQVVAPIITGVA